LGKKYDLKYESLVVFKIQTALLEKMEQILEEVTVWPIESLSAVFYAVQCCYSCLRFLRGFMFCMQHAVLQI
jgi:hypothetical protein